MHNFSLTAASGNGFNQAAANTLEFRVYNESGPTGLLVNFTEGFAEAQVPEPATFATLGFSMLALGLMRRRR
ncbi:MAG: PEP-CTERM sorting domain-containing protein [Acidobacteria bacterium]|nr:PEP-CTERM sorting domain-containing protein [Acidobacteriota bacterium]